MPGETCFTPIQANIFLFKVNNRSTRKMCGICSELTVKTPERRHRRCSDVFIVNFEHISHLFLKLPLLTLNKQIGAGICFTPMFHFISLLCKSFFSILYIITEYITRYCFNITREPVRTLQTFTSISRYVLLAFPIVVGHSQCISLQQLTTNWLPFPDCHSVSFVDFEQVNTGRVSSLPQSSESESIRP